MLTDVSREIVNKLYKENFNITFMKNIKKSSTTLVYHFLIKIFFKIVHKLIPHQLTFTFLKWYPNRVKHTHVFMEFQNEIVETSQD